MRQDHPRGSGFFHVPAFLSNETQLELIELARAHCFVAPLRRPALPNGQPLRLTLTNFGDLGWWSDGNGGYRYIERHPTTNEPWPVIPARLLDLAQSALSLADLPAQRFDNCLLNHYAQGESLGMHIDRSETDKQAPIVSLSIGADAEFVLEHPDSEGIGFMRKTSFVLRSGDLVVQSGRSRGYLHGIKRIMPTLPNPCRDGGRINFTMRKVRLP